ncbi:SDR family oxidoreductase [Geofilum rubicundum]|uniref:FolM Alternative dihydrofolate reductase 1 n=1 Tax=Geofilum rubicundum JCM 15548 TaxID=1236989 RepID=A0A0E9LYD8_9BACT|nr:SDR family oxidoreductase [Geofilum rubicundum]GAO30274.1 FolM Alternative dihydrofolate reductase 1 [Geofilum rubicundum JCM 15548]
MPTVLITGAAKRVGKALTELFAARGWEVIIHYHTSERAARDLSLSLQKKYDSRHFPVVQADLSNPVQSVEMLLKQLPQPLAGLDALINNASVFDASTLAETDYDLWRRQMLVNFETPFMLMQAFYKMFGKGAVVNVLDTRIVNNDSSHAAYSLSKKALTQLTQMAALEWAPDVRVNGVAPGPVLPPPGRDSVYFEKVAADTPLKRVVGLDSLAESVWFLVANSAITGQVIYCDSGAHLNG